MEPDTETAPGTRRRRTTVIATATGLLCVGAFAGGMIATASNAGATTTTADAGSSTGSKTGGTSTGSASSVSAPGAPGAPSATGTPPIGTSSNGSMPTGSCAALPLRGTVTAVGSSSVTIKTAGATATYSVTGTSTIWKDGKATLADLAVGDDVEFSTVTVDGVVAIGTLRDGVAPVAGAPNGAGGPPGQGGPGPTGTTPPSASSAG